MEPFLKYIKQLDADKRLLDIYRQLRHLFKKYKWSEKDLEKPPFYTNDMMELHSYFNIEKPLGIEVPFFKYKFKYVS